MTALPSKTSRRPGLASGATHAGGSPKTAAGMKEYLTADDIAAEQLPTVPTTKKGVLLMAEREGWNTTGYARARIGRGGGMEYSWKLLPIVAQAAYLTRYTAICAAPEPQPAPARTDLNDRERLARDARVAILTAFEVYLSGQKARSRTVEGAMLRFAARYNNRSIAIDQWIVETVPRISRKSLSTWRAKRKAGTDALAFDRGKARRGTGLLDTAQGGEVRAFVLGWIAANPALSAGIIRGYCEDHFGAEIIDRHGVPRPLPPPRTFQHWIANLKTDQHVALTKLTDPDRFRSTMKLSGTGTLRHIDEPNALWMIDASPVDALCTDGRHSLYACIDIATRRLTVTLSKTPRASAVGLLVRKAILAWGVASVIKTDNGSDFVAIATKQLFANLAIEADVSDAYSPEQKGHVERVIRTIQHEVCPQLPGYVGHSVAERKAIEGRRSFAERLGADERELFQVSLSAAELQARIDDWLAYVYQERGHSGLRGRSPNEVAQASLSPIRRVDERALDALLMPVAGKNGTRTMTKQGIKHDGRHYLTGSILPGTSVFCRLDPLDMGRMYVFDGEDGRYLDVALCPELADVNPAEYVQAQKQLQAELIAEKTREIKSQMREIKSGPSGIDRTIALAKRQAAARDQARANVLRLPKREEIHTTPALAAALDAVTSTPANRTARPLNARAAEIHAAILREADMRGQSSVIHLDPDQALSADARMFRWARSVEQQIAAGVVIDEETAVRLTRYQASADYQTRRDIHEDFGLEAALRG